MRTHYTSNYLLNPTHPITVAVIGAGGTGCQAIQHLARIDYALYKLGHPGLQVTIYDFDIVTEANIGRQLFTVEDIGRNKAEVIASRINMFYGTSWECEESSYPSTNASTYNITVSCVDNAKARVCIGEYLRTKSNKLDAKKILYWLDMGNQVDRGQVVLGTIDSIPQPNKSQNNPVEKLKCVDELFDLTKVNEDESGPSCSLAEALTRQDLFINSIIAEVGCNLLWKLISSGSIQHCGAYINLSTLKVNPITV